MRRDPAKRAKIRGQMLIKIIAIWIWRARSSKVRGRGALPLRDQTFAIRWPDADRGP